MSDVTVSAPGQGQGEAYIWRPDQSAMRMFQLQGVRQARMAAVKAAEKAKEEQARRDLDKILLSSGKGFKYYQPVWQDFNKKFVPEYMGIQDAKAAQQALMYRKMEEDKVNSYELQIADPIEKDLSSGFVVPEKYQKSIAAAIRQASENIKGVPEPGEVLKIAYNNPDIFNRPAMGRKFVEDAKTQTIESGRRYESTTLKRGKLLTDKNELNEDLALDFIRKSPMAEQALVTDLARMKMQYEDETGKAPDQAKENEMMSKAIRNFFPEAAAGEFSKTVQYGAVPAAKEEKDESPKVSLSILPKSTPYYNRRYINRAADGRIRMTSAKEGDMFEEKNYALNITPDSVKDAKAIYDKIISSNTAVYPIGKLEDRQMRPTAKMAIPKKIGEKYTLSKAYSQGETISEPDLKILNTAKADSYISKGYIKKKINAKDVLGMSATIGNLDYTQRPFATVPIIDGDNVYDVGDMIPLSVVKRAKPSSYDMKWGFDIVPMQLQTETQAITTEDGATTKETTYYAAKNPKVNPLGEVFVPQESVSNLSGLLGTLAKKSGTTVENIKRQIAEANGLGMPTKTRGGKFFSKAPKKGSSIDF